MSSQATTTPTRWSEHTQAGSTAPPVALRCGSVDWLIDEEWHDHLLGPGSPDWFALERDDRAKLVKPGHLRKTWRVNVGDRTVYAKVYDLGDVLDLLKRLIRQDPARREWRKALAAARRGIPTVRPVAMGIHTGAPHRSVYLSEELADAVSLGEAFLHAPHPRRAAGKGPHPDSDPATGDQGPAINQVILATASLFAVAHERGFVHPDGHPTNLLVRTGADGGVEARFVDLYSAVLGRAPLSTQAAVRALAQLDHYFSFRRFASDMQRLRFLKAYLSARHPLGPHRCGRRSVETWVEDIVRASVRHAGGLARKRDRRLRRNGKYFATVKLNDGWIATVVLQLERRHAFPEADVPDRTCEEWLNSLNSLVTMLNNGGADKGLFDGDRLRYELNRPAGLLERLMCTLTRSAHRKTFELSHWRRHRDLPADLILACLERRNAGVLKATVLVRPNNKEAKMACDSDK